MLSSFYEKFQNVQDHISSSFRELTVGEQPPPDSPDFGNEYQAGRRLLAKYQDDWKWIRSLSEVNSTNARELNHQIQRIYKKTEATKTVFNRLEKELSRLDEMIISTESVVNNIGQLRLQAESIEKSLFALDDKIEAEMTAKRTEREKLKLSLFRQQMLYNLDHVRSQLSSEHDLKVRAKEANDLLLKEKMDKKVEI
ncbi:dysbindin protein homolog [Cimex lectularius]|uniref:Dysbindin domain-containing protein 1 n=1 Tax=Cimex lectularius TaxID=79782 RepID=A0A8I6R9B1_CIMLE|nr:dysbindin protein homolog [Cimex lectularius]